MFCISIPFFFHFFSLFFDFQNTHTHTCVCTIILSKKKTAFTLPSTQPLTHQLRNQPHKTYSYNHVYTDTCSFNKATHKHIHTKHTQTTHTHTYKYKPPNTAQHNFHANSQKLPGQLNVYKLKPHKKIAQIVQQNHP